MYNDEIYCNFYRLHGFDNHLKRKKAFGYERVHHWLDSTKHLQSSDASLKVFDAGCGTGFVLEAAQELGLSVSGCDLNQDCVDFCKNRGISDVTCSSLESISKDSSRQHKYDVVTMYDVVEHTPNPNQAIIAAKRLLKKDGLLVLYIPNIDSYIVKMLGLENTQWAWTPFHLYYFNKKTMSQFLVKHGFKPQWDSTGGMDIYDMKSYLDNYTKDLSAVQADQLWDLNQKIQHLIDSEGQGSILRIYATNAMI